MRPRCFWLDQTARPSALPALSGADEADLAIVGGGFTGLWSALQAKEADPEREVVLVEASEIAEGASGRNGGFADPSLTHGLLNGLHHFPDEIEPIEKLGRDNYEGFLAALDRYEIDARVERNGVLSVATAPYQVEGLREYLGELQRFGEDAEWLDRASVRAALDSPTYCAGVWRRSGAIVDPARLAWGLRDAVLRLGVRIYEHTQVERFARAAGGFELDCSSGDVCEKSPGSVRAKTAGSVRAKKVVFATNAFRSPLRRMRRATIPIWDYALVTEPLSPEQREALGWKQRQGVGDNGNQFHYYRLTSDDRILWGGYDAIYHYGGRTDTRFQQRPESFEGLSRRFFDTFPQLAGLRFTHGWGGPIATTTRFCLDAGSAYGGCVSWAIGYTGLGVVASRFGARVALDLIDCPEAPYLSLGLVRKRPFPWPPEPIRSIAVALTQRALARADRSEGRRGPWLRLLDRVGLGFDS
jgi:glycine/D-amino acid oxidase-like deaminating enzyme